jgi:excisionase family DNA binding protein
VSTATAQPKDKSLALPRSVYTTGQVARICQVAPRTVSKWFDSGRLQGYQIPGGRDRRVPRAALLRFLVENRMDVPEVLGDPPVLLVGLPAQEIRGARVSTAPDAFTAGVSAGALMPAVVVIDARGMGRIEAGQLAASAAALPSRPTLFVVGFPVYPPFWAEVRPEPAAVAEAVQVAIEHREAHRCA